MDLMNYATLGGLERIAIIAGAVLIGYWGYRIQNKAQTPGLVFMAIACAMLVGALLTTGSHMRSVSASVAANTPPPASDPLAATPPGAEPEVAGDPSATVVALAGPGESNSNRTPVQENDEPDGPWAPDKVAQPASDSVHNPDPVDAAPASISEAAVGSAELASDQERLTNELVPLATGSELGGRIVSIRSENITLEWADGNN